MGQWDWPSLEGRLYAIGGHTEAEARPAQSVIASTPRPPSPERIGGQPPGGRATEERLDLAIALDRLPPEHVEVLTQHYIYGVSRSYRDRQPAIRGLLELLNDE